MNIHIKPSSVNGVIHAPASKSYMQRAIVASMLADGKSVLSECSLCNDTNAVLNIARNLGAKIQQNGDIIEITGGFSAPETSLNCQESGLALRLLSPIVATLPVQTTIIGEGSLINRPIDMITDALTQLKLGVTTSDGKLPITISGNLSGGNLDIDGSLGSQLLTGLLMALPLVKNNSKITVRNLKSKPYIDMTMDILQEWNIQIIHHNYQEFLVPGNQHYKHANYTIEGDWSNAAFMLVAAAIGGEITVHGLNYESRQGDSKIIEVLAKVGASIWYSNNSVSVKKVLLNGFDFDASDCPDLFPPLVALAAHCNSKSTIYGVSRLLTKESNRAQTLEEEFSKIGVKISISEDKMVVNPSKIKLNTVNSHNDHRIAMALAITSLCSRSGIEIEGFECINKSYPEFYNDLKKITQQE